MRIVWTKWCNPRRRQTRPDHARSRLLLFSFSSNRAYFPLRAGLVEVASSPKNLPSTTHTPLTAPLFPSAHTPNLSFPSNIHSFKNHPLSFQLQLIWPLGKFHTAGDSLSFIIFFFSFSFPLVFLKPQSTSVPSIRAVCCFHQLSTVHVTDLFFLYPHS